MTQTLSSWYPVTIAPGDYKISHKGDVMSLKDGPKRYGKLLAWITSSYHPKVNLSIGGKVTQYAVHVLVAAAFLGPTPPGMVVFHKDHNPKNPEASNLEFRVQGDWSKK